MQFLNLCSHTQIELVAVCWIAAVYVSGFVGVTGRCVECKSEIELLLWGAEW